MTHYINKKNATENHKGAIKLLETRMYMKKKKNL